MPRGLLTLCPGARGQGGTPCNTGTHTRTHAVESAYRLADTVSTRRGSKGGESETIAGVLVAEVGHGASRAIDVPMRVVVKQGLAAVLLPAVPRVDVGVDGIHLFACCSLVSLFIVASG